MGWFNSIARIGAPAIPPLLIIEALLTVYTLFSFPSNLNSSPYLIDQGVTIGLNPDPTISCWNIVGLS